MDIALIKKEFKKREIPPHLLQYFKLKKENHWILRSDIIWAKQIYIHKEKRTIGSVMPSPVKDRFNVSYEHLFHFVKSQRYYFNLDDVRIPIQTFEDRDMGIDREKEYPNSKRNRFDYAPFYAPNKFNYRVRDAKKKSGQCPQFKASEEEIKKYKENYIDDDKGARRTRTKIGLLEWQRKQKAKMDLLNTGKDIGISSMSARIRRDKQRKIDQTAQFFQKEKGQGGNTNLPYRPDKRAKETRKQGMHTFYSHSRRPNKVNDPRGNHEGGPGSWRDFKDENPSFTYPQGKNLPTCWLIGTEPSKELHFARFPSALCEIPIKVSTPKNGIVLDPFMGSGQAGVMALKLDKKFIGIELNKAFINIAIPKLEAERTLF